MKIIISEQIYSNIILENSNSKIVKLGANVVDDIRKINKHIDEELYNAVFKYPNVYAKGGAARLALQIYIDSERYSNEIIRDSDFAFIGSRDEWETNTHNDIVNYEGENFISYFKTRDVSANEVLLRPDALIFTRRAYNDISNSKMNPKSNDYRINSRLASRLLLFAARYNYTVSSNLEINPYFLNEFDFLVALFKAYELKIENKFFNKCYEHNTSFGTNNLTEFISKLLLDISGFDLRGREDLLLYDIKNSYAREEILETYPSLRKALYELNDDDGDYEKYLSKPNRNKQKKYR